MSSDVDWVPRAEGHVSPFGRAVERMHVSVTAVDGLLAAQVDGWYDIRVTVDDDYATRTPDVELERGLEGLARLLFAARTREYYGLMEVHLQPNPVTLRRMRDDLEAVVEDAEVTGTAAGGDVEVTSIGMRQFVVRLAPGVAARLGGEELGRALTRAADEMARAWLQVLADYKQSRWT
jgi:hypothetical protein